MIFFISKISINAQTISENINPSLHELNFPYQDNLIITYSSKKVSFDNYNFPKETSLGSMKYAFSNFKAGILKVIYSETYKKDSFTSVTYLQINNNGMTYWYDDKDSSNLKKTTLAISLPLFKGKTWTTYFIDKKSEATCLSLDTIISTPYGNLNAFAIRYIARVKQKSTRLIDHYISFTEFYNPKYGKIKMNFLEYGQIKENKRIVRYKEEENIISSFNLNNSK